MHDLIEYQLGIETLDRDHEELFRLIQRLDAAIHADQDFRSHTDAVDSLVAYVQRHFDEESRYMRTSRYSAEKAAAHEAEHALLLRRVEQWQQQRAAIGSAQRLVFDMCGYLEAWMHHHIKGHDAALASFLHSKGHK